MHRLFFLVITSFTFTWTLSGGEIVEASSLNAAPPQSIDALIEQLGDRVYAKREAASRELISIGIMAKPAILKTSQQTTDPEIRIRCERLLPMIDYGFCWDRAKRVLGDTPQAFAQFDAMYPTERELWYAFTLGSLDFPQMYIARCKELATGPTINGRAIAPVQVANPSRYELSDSRLATLLVLGVECRNQIPKETLLLATQLFQRTWGGKYAKDTPPALRKSYVTWAEEIAPLPIEYIGDRKLEVARDVLRSTTATPRDRQFALLTVARAKDERDSELIRRYLNDESIADTLFMKGVKIQIQLRDIALAASIFRAGRDPSEFGFKFVKSDPEWIYRPSTLGFMSDENRVEAFRAWNNAANMP